jgi:hypothetical protein
MSSHTENDLGELANVIYKLTAHFLTGEIGREEHIKTLEILLERYEGLCISEPIDNEQYIVG